MSHGTYGRVRRGSGGAGAKEEGNQMRRWTIIVAALAALALVGSACTAGEDTSSAPATINPSESRSR